MKVSFRKPDNGQATSVNLSDHVVNHFLISAMESGIEYQDALDQVRGRVRNLARDYYEADPPPVTFVAYVESVLLRASRRMLGVDPAEDMNKGLLIRQWQSASQQAQRAS